METEYKLILTNRAHLQLGGVTHVSAFSEQQIGLVTRLGHMTIDGEELDIQQLDLESGHFVVTGTITSIVYHGEKKRRGRGLLERLLK